MEFVIKKMFISFLLLSTAQIFANNYSSDFERGYRQGVQSCYQVEEEIFSCELTYHYVDNKSEYYVEHPSGIGRTRNINYDESNTVQAFGNSRAQAILGLVDKCENLTLEENVNGSTRKKECIKSIDGQKALCRKID